MFEQENISNKVELVKGKFLKKLCYIQLTCNT